MNVYKISWNYCVIKKKYFIREKTNLKKKLAKIIKKKEIYMQKGNLWIFM